MLIYLLKFTICLAILYFFYKICLENEHMHVFKRIYLLASLVAALLIPALVFNEYVEVLPTTYVTTQEYAVPQATAGPIGIPQALEKDVLDMEPILWTVYFIGVLFFGLKFLKNLIQIGIRIQKNPKQKWEQFIHVLLKDALPPHTFLSYIFLNKQKFEAQEIPKAVLLHEQTHARQRHSYDILFVEFLQVIFWINPFIYLLKKAIKLNHEFLADEAVLNKNISKSNYQNTLLSYLSEDNQHHQSPLVNPINYSSIKKRFTIMKTKTSRKAVLLRSILVLPLLAVLTYSFSETTIIPIEKEQIYDSEIPAQDLHLSDSFKEELKKLSISKSEITYVSIGATEALMSEYTSFIKGYEESQSIKYDTYNRIIAIYDIMTEEQKNSVTKYPEFPVITNTAVTDTKPLKVEKFEAFKSKADYAIWIDGKHVANNTLDNFKVSDIVYHSESFVYNNARSEQFPQAHQAWLYTQKGFEKFFRKAKVNNYNKLLEEFKKEISHFNPQTQIDNSELRIMKVRLNQLYSLIAKSDLKKYDVKQAPEVPKTKMSLKPKASEQQLIKYNAIANKYNTIPIENRTIPLTDLHTLENIYRQMTPYQKANAQPFPECLPKNKQEEVFLVSETIEIRINKNGQLLIKDQIVAINNLATVLKSYNRDMTLAERKSSVASIIYIFENAPKAIISKASQALTDYGVATIDIKKVYPPAYTMYQNGISTKELAEYNKLAKHYNSMSGNKMKIYKKDVERLEYLFSKMSKKQKATAEPFPDFPVPPTAPRAPRAVNEREEALHTIETIIENQDPYDNVHANIMSEENVRVYKYTSKRKPTEKINLELYAEKLGLTDAQFYFEGEKISTNKGLKIIKDGNIKVETFPYKNKQPEVRIYKSDSKGTIPPPPHSPEAPKVLKGSVSTIAPPPSTVVIKGTASSIPTPPEPMTPLDHVIAMAKKDATFLYEGKEISSDRAINLMKTNKDLNIDSRTAKGKKPVVKISIEPIAH